MAKQAPGKNGHAETAPVGFKVDEAEESQEPTRILAAAFPLSTPKDVPERHRTAYWKRLNDSFRTAWSMSTDLANWAVIEMLKLEGMIDPSQKMPKPPKFPVEKGGLYKWFCLHYPLRGQWDGAAQSASCILHRIQKIYTGNRFEVLKTRRRRLDFFTYPYPYPVHNQSWKTYFTDSGEPMLSVTLPGGRQELRLRTGEKFRRQLAFFRSLHGGAGKKMELSIYRTRRDKTMVKLVGRFPLDPGKDLVNSMVVKTYEDALFAVDQEGYQRTFFNYDHFKRRVECYERRRARVAEDMHYESRKDNRSLTYFRRLLAKMSVLHNDWLDTATHTVTKNLVSLALWRKVATVIYDDSIKKFIPRFPWAKMKGRLAYKMEHAGIQLLGSPDATAEEGEEVDSVSSEE